MPRSYKKYTDDNIIENTKCVKSMAALIRSLGLIEAGGNYRTMKDAINRLNLDTSHWTKELWSEGERLKDWSQYTKNESMRKHLYEKYDNACQICKTKDWQNQRLPLEVHHVDGNRKNNQLSNLQLLCPNCHAQTPNWRRQKANADT